MTLDELNAKGVLADVFFAYDSVELNPDARTVLQKNTDYLKRWASTKVMVEGHADARGTNEYNLALGERRAGAARDYVVSLGIPVDRVTIVSKGEEAPVCREDNEACYDEEPPRPLRLHGQVGRSRVAVLSAGTAIRSSGLSSPACACRRRSAPPPGAGRRRR